MFMILLFLQFAVSFAFMLNMISFPRFCCELVNACISFMVASTIDQFPLFSFGRFAIAG